MFATLGFLCQWIVIGIGDTVRGVSLIQMSVMLRLLVDCCLLFQCIHFISFQNSQSMGIRFREDEVVVCDRSYSQVGREARL